jgi:LPXTG-motif cell wall-anchored protein
LKEEKNKMKKAILMLALILAMPMIMAQPLLLIDISNQEPRPAVQGQTADIYVTFTNTGQTDIRDLEVEFKDSNFLRLTSETDRIRNIPVLGTFRDYTIKYTVQVDANAPDGQVFANLVYTIGNLPGEATRNLPIQVRSQEPVVAVNYVRTNPEVVVPGQEFDLTVSLRNMATAPVRDVVLELDVSTKIVGSAIVQDLPFIPLTSNQRSLNRINSGQTSEFTFKMLASPDATPKAYKIPLTLRYFDDSGNQRTLDLTTGLLVNGKADLVVAVDQTNINKNQRTGDITFLVINRGLTDMKMTTIEILSGEGFDIQSPSNLQYLGTLDSDDFDTIRYRLTINEDDVTIPLKFVYKDALNQEFEETINVQFNAKEQQSSSNTGLIVIIILILLGVGYFVYRRKRKQRQ